MTAVRTGGTLLTYHCRMIQQPVMISMLRGVNLAKHNRMSMEVLRELYESLRLREPRTYIQSGNVVFRTNETNPEKLASRIEKAIADRLSIRTQVILRRTEEMRDVIRRNPVAERTGIEPGKLAVTFLSSAPGPEAVAKLRAMDTHPEELWIDGREMYIYYTNGMARPKISAAGLERALKIPGTARNWNTVMKLLQMAEEMEAG
jgi:uncharacterized protein (DUF1697 family)